MACLGTVHDRGVWAQILQVLLRTVSNFYSIKAGFRLNVRDNRNPVGFADMQQERLLYSSLETEQQPRVEDAGQENIKRRWSLALERSLGIKSGWKRIL